MNPSMNSTFNQEKEGILEVCTCVHNVQTHENNIQNDNRERGVEISKSCTDREESAKA